MKEPCYDGAVNDLDCAHDYTVTEYVLCINLNILCESSQNNLVWLFFCNFTIERIMIKKTWVPVPSHNFFLMKILK